MRLLEDIRAYTKSPQVIAGGGAASLLFQLFGLYGTYLIGVSLGDSTGLTSYFILLPIVWLVSMIPVSLNGLGVREGAFVYLFALAGMQYEMALAISLIFLLQGILQGMLGAMVFVLDKKEVAAVKGYAETGIKGEGETGK